jgi:hypothetical protein
VWLASYSRRSYRVLGGRAGSHIKATGTWKPEDFEEGYRRLCDALRGVGRPDMERLFRMNVTLCLHRVATDEEVEGLRGFWDKVEPGLAGGPVEVLWSKGLPLSESCKPCHHPKHQQVVASRPDLWVPQDCRQCPPCLARAACAAEATCASG